MEQGWVVLVVGMSTVFSFLVLLVSFMRASAFFFQRYAHWFPDDIPSSAGAARDETAKIAAAVAAVRHRLR